MSHLVQQSVDQEQSWCLDLVEDAKVGSLFAKAANAHIRPAPAA